MKKLLVLLILFTMLNACENKTDQTQNEPIPVAVPFMWEGANIYFLLTDRFNNGNPDNDVNFDRSEETALLRGFEGGDIQGITAKLNEAYFSMFLT